MYGTKKQKQETSQSRNGERPATALNLIWNAAHFVFRLSRKTNARNSEAAFHPSRSISSRKRGCGVYDWKLSVVLHMHSFSQAEKAEVTCGLHRAVVWEYLTSSAFDCERRTGQYMTIWLYEKTEKKTNPFWTYEGVYIYSTAFDQGNILPVWIMYCTWTIQLL